MTIQEPRLRAIVDWIRLTTVSANGRGVLVPVSGGTDSALCFWLCCEALPADRVVGAYVGGALRCRSWFESQQGRIEILPEHAEHSNPEIERWSRMLERARSVRGWLVGSRNRTEQVLGNYSLASRLATYFPLLGLWKSEVMEMAELVGVPEEILASSARADPLCGRDPKLAAIPFIEVDRFLQAKIGSENRGLPATLLPEQLSYLEGVYQRNRFKAELPLSPLLCSTAR
jgi:NAD+ synthase